jgi:prolipoprotein diacylglyceryl transferase
MNTLFASIPSPSISYIDLGPVRVHFYALFILIGIAVAIWIANHRLTKRGATSGAAVDIALWAVPFGIIGGRIFHVLTHPNDYFYDGADLLAVFRIWEGGLAIFGGLILGSVGAWIGAKQAGVKFWSFADAVAPGVLIAQAIGRLGNYFNQELFGLPTDLPWGLEIDFSNAAYPKGLPMGQIFHPTFAYEMIWSLVGAFVLLYLDRKFELRWGKLFGLYLVWYSVGRIWIESIRIDPSEVILGLRINVWSALAGIAVGLAVFYIQRQRHTGLELSAALEKDSTKPADEIVYGLESEEGSSAKND